MASQENPESLSFGEKLKKFQNQDADTSRTRNCGIKGKTAVAKGSQSNGDEETKAKPTLPHIRHINKTPYGIARDLQNDIERSSDVLEEDINGSDFWDEALISSDYRSVDSAESPVIASDSIKNDKEIIEENCITKVQYRFGNTNFSDSLTEDRPASVEKSSSCSTPYPTAPYPLVNSAVGRSLPHSPAPPIGFECLVPHSTGIYNSTSISTQDDSSRQTPTNYLIEPKMAMPFPDFSRSDSKDS